MYVFILLCGGSVGFYLFLLVGLHRDSRRRRRALSNPTRTVKLGTVFAMDTASVERPMPVTLSRQHQVVVELSSTPIHSGRRSYAHIATRGRAWSVAPSAGNGEESRFS
jgi:hypothetical protein